MTLVVSILPRGRRGGRAGVLALAPGSLETLAYRSFADEEFMAEPATGFRSGLRHCRGLACADGRMYAALFNAVAEYRWDDPARLELVPVRHWTSPAAVDLHGIAIAGDRLMAASTGSDRVLSWNLGHKRRPAEHIHARERIAGDLRFPDRAPRADVFAWRGPGPFKRHLNDVTPLADGRIVVCGLHVIALVDPSTGRAQTLVADRLALLHDGRDLGGGRLLFSDGARGEVVLVDVERGVVARLPVADPQVWFVRGICVDGEVIYVLGNERGPNEQLRMDTGTRPDPARGARLRVAVLDADLQRIAMREVAVDEAPAGGVGYAAVRLVPGPPAPADARARDLVARA